MLEYPEMKNLSKSPREYCIAFNKLDGQNIRVKYDKKNKFSLFGSRHRLFDETDNQFEKVIPLFNNTLRNNLERLIVDNKDFKDFKELIVFMEYYGPNSFAGMHDENDILNNLMKLVVFDILIINKKNINQFILPNDFIKLFNKTQIEIPNIIYEGNLNDTFIKNVKNNIYNLKEGVVCKGITKRGDYRGKVWMCKIKTQYYLDRIKQEFGEKGLQLYGE